MTVSTVIKHDLDGAISLADGAGTPVVLAALFSNGDFSLTGLKRSHKETVKYAPRGVLASVRYGNRTYPTGSFTAMVSDLSDATDRTLIDFIRRTGASAANVSTLGANAEVYTINITLTIEGTDHGDSADHTIVLTNCDCTIDVVEGQPNMVTINFEVLGTVTMT